MATMKRYNVFEPKITNTGRNTKTEWINPVIFKGIMFPATSDTQVQICGKELKNIMTLVIKGKYQQEIVDKHILYKFKKFNICEGYGIGDKDSTTAFYNVISIKAYKNILICDCEVWNGR